jgi:hypothetical protein
MRALLLTKGEPNTHQVGRIVERFNSLGTMRVLALKSYPLIRDASNHMRICGQRLEKIVGLWTRQRELIEEVYLQKQVEETDDRLYEVYQDDKNEKLLTLANGIENHLLDIYADLDAVQRRVPGGLKFHSVRINGYTTQMHKILAQLDMRGIEGWMNYDQSINENILPKANLVVNTSDHEDSLRRDIERIRQSLHLYSSYDQGHSQRRGLEQQRVGWDAQRMQRVQVRIADMQLRLSVIFSILTLFIAVMSADEFFALFGYDLKEIISQAGQYLRGE